LVQVLYLFAFKSGPHGGHKALPYEALRTNDVGAGFIPISAQISSA
jgi:hypothetical protein